MTTRHRFERRSARAGLAALVQRALLILALAALGPTTGGAHDEASSLVAPTRTGYVLHGPAEAEGGPPHPATFLGYELGSRFTYHHRIVDYLEALAASSERVRVEEYGHTAEDRPLVLATISSPRNLERLDEILAAHRSGLDENGPALVWLAYGVHGNESSSAEAAMAVAYSLAADEGDLARSLDDVVVFLDPLVNPDGRERYVQWFRGQSSPMADPHRDAMEHREPWPGGRFNHYLFDLNRDWTWLTQVESRQRLRAYRRVEPHVYVDVHEMNPDSTYFFPPPAEPVLPLVRADALDDLTLVGRGNAEAFDALGWTYFVREVYDFFYPGYGDTYPTLRGGLGMTYEMAGGGGAGKLLVREDGTELTLADRVARHAVSTLATVRTAAAHRERLVRGFQARRAALGPERTFLWSADQPESAALASLLVEHGIEVRRLADRTDLPVLPILPGRAVRRTFEPGTWSASTAQPLGDLLRALMERAHELSADFVERQRRRLGGGQDEEIFDITAWSLPLAFGVETWVADTSVRGGVDPKDWLDGVRREAADPVERPIGWHVEPQGVASRAWAARVLAHGVALRAAAQPDEDGTRGLFVSREDNGPVVEEIARRAAALHGVAITPVPGRAEALHDGARQPGSNVYERIAAPTIGLVGGRGVSATSHGGLWHLLAEVAGIQVRRLGLDRLAAADLGSLDVLVLPEGGYEGLGDGEREALDRWLRAGGTLVAVGSAFEVAESMEWTEVEPRDVTAFGSEISDDDPGGNSLDPGALSIPGAFVATTLQTRHPLALGTVSPPQVLVRGDLLLEPTGDPKIDVLRVRDESPVLAGLVWAELEAPLAGSLLVSSEKVGDGRLLVFAQDPAFRGFLRGVQPLLLDAILFGPSL